MRTVLVLLLVVSSIHALAPPPINFKKEIINVNGKNYVAGWDGASLTLDYYKPTYPIKDINEGPPINNNDQPPGPENPEFLFIGCFSAMVLEIIFFASVYYLIKWWFF